MASNFLFDELAIVLVSIRNPLNLGAAARAMSNFSFSDLRVVNPYGMAFREAKSAVGAAALLRRAKEYSTVADAVADCTLVVGTTAARDRKLNHPLRRLRWVGEILFWLMVFAGGYAIYLILTTIW